LLLLILFRVSLSLNMCSLDDGLSEEFS
jgi:hypothetical protein